MPRTLSQEHSALIPSDAVICDLSADKKAQKAQSNIGLKYKHADPSQLWRHDNRIAVLIRCSVPGCAGKRFVHSSDLFQVRECGSSDHSARPNRKPKTGRVRSKKGAKGGRKAARARKANGRARKAKRAPRVTATPARAE